MTTFEALTYREFGDPCDVLAIEARPFGELGAGDIRVRVTLSPINPSDVIPVWGAYRHRTRLPKTPGYEGVGVVTELGPGVATSWLGRRVLPLRGEGLWQQYATVPSQFAIRVPDSVDDETASQLYINPMTAWVIATKELRLNPDDVVVVNAGGSSLGHVFAQLSRILGYRLIAVCRTRQHTVLLKDLGAWAVISCADDGELPQAVKDLTQGLGASIGIDSIGGGDGHALIRCVRPEGTVLNIGLLSGIPINWIALGDQHPRVTVRPFWLRRWRETAPAAEWCKSFAELLALAKGGQLVIPPSCGRFRLRNFAAGLQMDQTRGRQGKVIFAPWD